MLPRDILLRAGGRTLLRYGVPVRRLIPEDPVNRLAMETFTRADASTCATQIGRDGLIRTAAANRPRIEWVDLDGDGIRETPGILFESSAVNVALWSRDLSNAAWTKSSTTAVKDQVGIDGVASSASSLLATGGNGTCLQAVTLASSARQQSCWIKRLIGSGNIQMTTDNGSTWTNVTVTSAYTRVTIPQQTLANPTLGFRIVTNGDKVAIDMVQNEVAPYTNNTCPTSAIPTTTVAVTRAADLLTIPLTFGPQNISILYRFARPAHADYAGDIGFFPGVLDVSTADPRCEVFFGRSARQFFARCGDSGSQASANLPAGASLVFASQHKDMATLPAVAIDLGSGFGAFDTGGAAFTTFANQTVRIGGSGTASLNGVFVDLMIAKGLLSIAEMAALL